MKYKGCIMEIREDSMVIMTADCSFRKIKKKNNLQEGMEIEFDGSDIILDKKKNLSFGVLLRLPLRQAGDQALHPRSKLSYNSVGVKTPPELSFVLSQFYLVAAAILLMVITSAFGFQYWSLFNQSVAIVTVDINPSLQLEVNYKNQVVDAIALNQDAEKLSLETLKRKPLQVALKILLQQAQEEGYIIHQEENYILVTTVVLQQNKRNIMEMERVLRKAKEEIEEKASMEGERIEVIAIDASEDMLIKAKKEQVSVGRLKIYEEVKESTKEKLDDFVIRDIKMKDLIRIRKETEIEKEHPVFDSHPSGKKKDEVKTKEEKEHPVFDNHPSEKKGEEVKTKGQKEHPVFKEHPSNKKNNNDSVEIQKNHPVFNQSPNNNKNKFKQNKKD